MEKLNRTPVIIASIVFAVGLWLIVNLGFDYTTTKDIPLVIQNLPDDIAFRTTPPEYIRARVRGEGWKLLGMQIGGETKYILDLGNERSTVLVRTATELPERLRVPSGIDVTELSPPQFALNLEQKSSRRIPIQPVLDVTYREGFSRIGPLSVSPDSVTILGAESVIATIDYWKTKPLVLRDVRDPVRRAVDLSDSLSRIIKLDIAAAEVRFDVQPIAEKTITGLRINVEGVPANREVMVIPPRIDLVVRGGINQLAAIDEESFSAQINYRDILADTSGIVTARIVGPNNVRIVQRSPERVRYVIRRTQ
jgi:YbbR domain-containing protein